MLKLLIGIVIGLIIGWNLLPQPAIVKRLYDRISDRFWKWLTSIVLLIACLSLVGCSWVPEIPGVPSASPRYPWKERVVAEIALASLNTSPTPAPDDAKVGDKCPICNDPPGGCGVGKTGDVRNCDRCQKCQGDGRIDQVDIDRFGSDLSSEPSEPAIEQSVLEVPKEITLHASEQQWRDWPSKWYRDSRKQFEDRGWLVRVVLEPPGASEIAYFDVQSSDGKVQNFFEILTLEKIEHLETR